MSDWADLRISGFLGFVHRLVMFITWPFRHWKYLLAFVAIVFLALVAYAFYHGVKWGDMYDWYKYKLSRTYNDNVKETVEATQQNIGQSVAAIKERAHEIAPEIIAAQEAKEKNEPIRFTAWNVAKFNKAKYQQSAQKAPKIKLKAPTFTPQTTDNTTPPQVVITQPKPAPVVVEQPKQMVEAIEPLAPQEPYYKGELDDYYTIRRDLDLTYLANSEKLYGKADVLGANSLYMENTYLYLYGIYTNPYNYDAEAAQLFLEKRFGDKPAHCDIVAYTSQTQMATALCFVDGELINKALVEAGLAENVALK